MNLGVQTNQGFEKTKILWVGAERAFQSKTDILARDEQGVFILPVILLERTGITKDVNRKGKYFANIPPVFDQKGGSITITKEINQEKTRGFASSHMNKKYKQVNFKSFKPEDKNKKIVYTIKSIPMPVYVIVNYEITLRTEYQQHLNDLLSPFLTFTGGVNYFVVEDGGNRHEVFIDESFDANNTTSDLEENERVFETKISLEVLAHLVGRGKNDDQPRVVERENIVSVVVSREQTWVEPIDPKIKKIW